MTYTFALSRRSLPVRCLCVLLCVLVLWCFFMLPRAGAVVAEAELAYWGGAIIVSVLAAGGMALATGDAQKVGSAMYGALKDTGGKAWDSICSLASWAAAAGSKAKDAAFRVGKDVWQAIVDCFNGSYSDGTFSYTGSFSEVTPANSARFFEYLSDMKLTSISFWRSNGDKLTYSIARLDGKVYLYYYLNGVFKKSLASAYDNDSEYWLEFYSDGKGGDYKIRAVYVSSFTSFLPADVYTVNVAVSMPDAIPVASPDLVYPSDDYLVKVPDIPATDSVTGALAWPSDAIYTKDAIAVPYPVDSEGVKVPDIPYDKALDKSTGKTPDDADTGTDTKPGEDTDTGTGTAGLIGSIIELLKNFFDSPGDFKLNFDDFKNLILPDRFPFCIPFDMVKAVKLFAVAAADFVFKIDLDTQFFSVHHTVDLTPYAVPIAFFRYACVFWFAWILLSRTRDLMKW